MPSLISVLLMLAGPKEGAGDSARFFPGCDRLTELVDTKEAPQISHSRRKGWLRKVHLGQATDGDVCKGDKPSEDSVPFD